MNDLNTLVELELNKLLTVHALTMHRGDTETEEKQTKAIMDMAYKAEIKKLMVHLRFVAKCFKSDLYPKELKDYAAELVMQGRDNLGAHMAKRGTGQADLDVADALRRVLKTV